MGIAYVATAGVLVPRWGGRGLRVALAVSVLALVAGAISMGRLLAPEARSPGGMWKYTATALQIAMVVLACETFDVEHQAFHGIVARLVLLGFLVHHPLASRFRLPFFVLLSLLTIGTVLGLRSGATLVAIGLALIGLCHLPVSFRLRAVLLTGFGAVLVLSRVGQLPSVVPAAIWPLVGAFFMFRTIAYFYDVRHARAPMGAWSTLAYFFLLPNVAFLLFPIVDFSTMRRTYFARDAFEIYQKGLRWLLRGTVYLLLYRFVYHHLVLPPSEIASSSDLARYLVANYLLLLQVLGQFDLAIGLLHLFGFDLPETNDLNLLASGFADFWRRTNTYWRDFVVKTVYYPVYFQVRRRGTTAGLVIATAVAFAATAALHAYQWLWLRGTPRFTRMDAVFWGTFGLLLVGAVVLESRRKTKASPALEPVWPERVARALRVAGMFALVSVLWALWTAPTLTEWRAILSYARTPPGTDLGWIAGAAGVLVLYGATFRFCSAPVYSPPSSPPFLAGWAVTSGAWLLLLVAGRPAVSASLGPWAANVAQNLKSRSLNRYDDQELVRSYYEDLAHVSAANPELWSVLQSAGVRRRATRYVELLTRPTRDLRLIELIENGQMTRRSETQSTNRWGMKDVDYEREKPPGAFRAAVLGGSYVIGFERRLEERLNRELGDGGSRRYELLNFAVGGFGPLQALIQLEKKAFAFSPDAVFFVAVEGQVRRPVECLARGIRMGVDLEHPYLRDLVSRARLGEAPTEAEMVRRLTPHRLELLAWIYRTIVEECRSRGVLPVWIGVLPVDMRYSDKELVDSRRLAGEAGFTVVDATDAYAGVDPASLRDSADDHHLNGAGNRMLVEALYAKLAARRDEILVPRR